MNNQPTIPEIKDKTILFCVLNWGLGHAARSIPLINHYAKQNRIIVASDGNALDMLKLELPGFSFIEMPKFTIQYSSKNMLLNMTRIFFQILNSADQNKYFIDAILERLPVDVIISDNRFGCWHKKTKSIYITHQLMVKLPGILKIFERWGFWMHKRLVRKFDVCWIPDYEETNNLSGDLSHKYKLKNQIFIGPLSRFQKLPTTEFEFDFCVLLGGPEPNRTELEKIVLEKFSSTVHKTLVLRGTPKDNMQFGYGNLQVHSHLSTDVLNKKLLFSKYIIARSGYSSIMDLHKLDKRAILIPTKDQPEQEYLGKYHNNKDKFYTMSEEDFRKISIENILKIFEN